jgi:hypothetical protein
MDGKKKDWRFGKINWRDVWQQNVADWKASIREEKNAHMHRTRSITIETITSWASSYLAYKE